MHSCLQAKADGEILLRSLCVARAQCLVQQRFRAVSALPAAGAYARLTGEIAHCACTVRHRLANRVVVNAVTDTDDHG